MRPSRTSASTTSTWPTRHVPPSDALLPIVRGMAKDKGFHLLLITSPSGARLHAAAFKRTTRWATTGRARRLHDLRHTAACLWLASGVLISTVQAWLGHSSLQIVELILPLRASDRIRTRDILITSKALYRLSYRGVRGEPAGPS